jgi:small acid-soluble spore protein L (minor)
MSKRKNKNRGTEVASSVNPQGYGQNEFSENPKTKLENEAKTRNTK